MNLGLIPLEIRPLEIRPLEIRPLEIRPLETNKYETRILTQIHTDCFKVSLQPTLVCLEQFLEGLDLLFEELDFLF